MEELFNWCNDVSSKVLTTDTNQTELRWKQQREIAYTQLYNQIVRDAEEIIRVSASCGYKRAEVFKYFKHDNLKYNGIFASDILRKGDFMSKLRAYFNPFSVYLNRITGVEGKDKDVICISWAKKQNEQTKQPEQEPTTEPTTEPVQLSQPEQLKE